MRKFLLLFLVLATTLWAQPGESNPAETADEAIAAEIESEQAEPAEETAVEETVNEAPVGEEVERAQSASMDLKDLFIAGGLHVAPSARFAYRYSRIG